jgi:hypothetical protein
MEGMTDLSPAAQQVFWEFNRAASGKPEDWHYLPAIAAALRAAADQVVPPALEEEWRDRNQALPLTKMVEIRLKLLAIAANLEALT